MKRNGKVAICSYIGRANTVPRLVALIGAPEVRSQRGELLASNGMHVIFLPYADDIRSPKLPKMEQRADDKLIAKARAMVLAMTIPPPERDTLPSARWLGRIWNPVLQMHYATVQVSWGWDVESRDIAARLLFFLQFSIWYGG